MPTSIMQARSRCSKRASSRSKSAYWFWRPVRESMLLTVPFSRMQPMKYSGLPSPSRSTLPRQVHTT